MMRLILPSILLSVLYLKERHIAVRGLVAMAMILGIGTPITLSQSTTHVGASTFPLVMMVVQGVAASLGFWTTEQSRFRRQLMVLVQPVAVLALCFAGGLGLLALAGIGKPIVGQGAAPFFIIASIFGGVSLPFAFAAGAAARFRMQAAARRQAA